MEAIAFGWNQRASAATRNTKILLLLKAGRSLSDFSSLPQRLAPAENTMCRRCGASLAAAYALVGGVSRGTVAFDEREHTNRAADSAARSRTVQRRTAGIRLEQLVSERDSSGSPSRFLQSTPLTEAKD